MHAASRGKGWRQAGRAREAGDRSLAAFSVGARHQASGASSRRSSIFSARRSRSLVPMARRALSGRAPGESVSEGVSPDYSRSGTPEAREAGERRKPTAAAVGKVRSKRNKPAKRAIGISRRFLSPASRACSSLFRHPQLALWASELPPASRALLRQELPVGPAYLGASRQFSAVYLAGLLDYRTVPSISSSFILL